MHSILQLPRTRCIGTFAACLAMLCGIVTFTNPVQADDAHANLAAAMKELGDEVAQYIKADPDAGGKVAVGEFSGPTGGGARITQMLREKLAPMCQVVEKTGAGSYTVGGKFRGQKQDTRFVTVVEAEICDALGNNVHSLRKKIITNIEEGLAVFGPSSVDLSSDASTSQASKPGTAQAEKKDQVVAQKMVSAIVNPEVHLDSQRRTVMKVSEQSPFGMEILVKQTDGTYVPLEVKDEKGVAKVEIDVSQVYAVRLYNHSSAPVGCRLTIDGINIFALSEESHYKGKDTIMTLDASGKYLIKGWHHRGDISHEFLVCNYGDSAAASLGASDGLGMITATFFEAIPPAGHQPGLKSRDFGTKQGDQTTMKYDAKEMTFGKPLGAVSTRYPRAAHPGDLPPT